MDEHCEDCAPEFTECWNDKAKCRKQPQDFMALLTCPFCISGQVKIVLYNQPCVVCDKCGATGPSVQRLRSDTHLEQAKREAGEAWNKRPLEHELSESLCAAVNRLQEQADYLQGLGELTEKQRVEFSEPLSLRSARATLRRLSLLKESERLTDFVSKLLDTIHGANRQT